MKKILKLMLASAVLALAVSATVDAQPTVVNFSGYADTVKTVTVKNMDLGLRTPGPVTIQASYQRITDTVNGTITLLASINGSRYAPYPGAAVLPFSSRDTSQIWIIQPLTKDYQLVPNFRLEVKTTKANGQGRVYGQAFK